MIEASGLVKSFGALRAVEEEEVDVAPEVTEQAEEVAIAAKSLRHRARPPGIVSTNAFDGQVEPVGNPSEAPARLVDRPLAIDLKAGKDHHPTDCVTEVKKRLELGSR